MTPASPLIRVVVRILTNTLININLDIVYAIVMCITLGYDGIGSKLKYAVP